jgi:adenine specific DNA methylase Mod
MKFTIDLDLKFNSILKKEALTIVEEAIISSALKHHTRLLNLDLAIEATNPSIESKKLIEHHTTWISLLENAKIDCEEL